MNKWLYTKERKLGEVAKGWEMKATAVESSTHSLPSLLPEAFKSSKIRIFMQIFVSMFWMVFQLKNSDWSTFSDKTHSNEFVFFRGSFHSFLLLENEKRLLQKNLQQSTPPVNSNNALLAVFNS